MDLLGLFHNPVRSADGSNTVKSRTNINPEREGKQRLQGALVLSKDKQARPRITINPSLSVKYPSL